MSMIGSSKSAMFTGLDGEVYPRSSVLPRNRRAIIDHKDAQHVQVFFMTAKTKTSSKKQILSDAVDSAAATAAATAGDYLQSQYPRPFEGGGSGGGALDLSQSFSPTHSPHIKTSKRQEIKDLSTLCRMGLLISKGWEYRPRIVHKNQVAVTNDIQSHADRLKRGQSAKGLAHGESALVRSPSGSSSGMSGGNGGSKRNLYLAVLSRSCSTKAVTPAQSNSRLPVE